MTLFSTLVSNFQRGFCSLISLYANQHVMSSQEESLNAALVCAQNYLAFLKDFGGVNLLFIVDLLCELMAIIGKSPVLYKPSQ